VASTEVERHTGVDVQDVPSAEWGWSKENHKLIHIGGLLSAAFLLLMMRGNHVGHIENWFLIAFAALIVIAVARDWWLRRRGWTR
jgi:4-amino-4-deoxy-L-arabinose transferase-like glycosyltransferase